VKAKLDENLGSLGADFLRAAGIDVVTVADQGLLSAPDHTVLGVCAAGDRCVITLDTDFANLLHYQPRDYAGIVLVRLPGRLRLAHLGARVGDGDRSGPDSRRARPVVDCRGSPRS
jgi:hypothetical protein